MVPICCDGGPRNSGLTRCSITHTTKPVKKKKARLASQRSVVNGFKKIHAFLLLSSFTRTTIDTPDSVYGNVKSTYKDRFATIVVSPTTASNLCISIA